MRGVLAEQGETAGRWSVRSSGTAPCSANTYQPVREARAMFERTFSEQLSLTVDDLTLPVLLPGPRTAAPARPVLAPPDPSPFEGSDPAAGTRSTS